MTQQPFGGAPATPFGGTPAPQPQQQPFGGAPAQPAPQPQAQPQQTFAQPGPTPGEFTPPWQSPSEIPTGDNVDFRELKGALLLFTPKEYRLEIETKFGKKDCVVADIAVIGARKTDAGQWVGVAPEQSEVMHDAYVFPARLVGKLKNKVRAGMVLGRLTEQPTDKGNPAHDLDDPTPQDQQAAMAFYNASAAAAPPF